MSTKYGHMTKCDCGNIYVPTGKPICPPCHRVVLKAKFFRRTKAKDARRKRKLEERQLKKRNSEKAA